MVVKSTLVAFVLATLAVAANYKRVICPDGVNTVTNEAVSNLLAICKIRR